MQEEKQNLAAKNNENLEEFEQLRNDNVDKNFMFQIISLEIVIYEIGIKFICFFFI